MATAPERLEAPTRALGVWLRRALPGDAAQILAWRNEAADFAADPRAVPEAEHHAWWTAHVEDPTRCTLWLAQLGARPVGMIRFDRAEPMTARVSIYLAPSYRGWGLGPRVFREAWGARPYWAETVEAVVRADNPAAQAFFTRLGFREIAHTAQGRRYRRTVDAA